MSVITFFPLVPKSTRVPRAPSPHPLLIWSDDPDVVPNAPCYSRFPEPGSYNGWVALWQKFQNATYTAKGPLSFIPSWAFPEDDYSHQTLYLTSTGAGEAFSLGCPNKVPSTPPSAFR